MSGRPQAGWRTFGIADFIRVPLPAARTTTWRSDIRLPDQCSLTCRPACPGFSQRRGSDGARSGDAPAAVLEQGPDGAGAGAAGRDRRSCLATDLLSGLSSMARRRCSTRLVGLRPRGPDDRHHVVGVVAAGLLLDRALHVTQRRFRVPRAQRHRRGVDPFGGRLGAGGALGGFPLADAQIELRPLDQLPFVRDSAEEPGGRTRRRRRSRGAAGRERPPRRCRSPRRSSAFWAAAAERRGARLGRDRRRGSLRLRGGLRRHLRRRRGGKLGRRLRAGAASREPALPAVFAGCLAGFAVFADPAVRDAAGRALTAPSWSSSLPCRGSRADDV